MTNIIRITNAGENPDFASTIPAHIWAERVEKQRRAQEAYKAEKARKEKEQGP